MSLNTPKRVRVSTFSSPPASSDAISGCGAVGGSSIPSPWNSQWTDSPMSSASSTCGSPEFIPHHSQQQFYESRENRRGRPRSEALTTLMIQGSTSPSAIKCTYCNRVFPREKSLQAHLRTHTGERPYNCDYPGCTRAFTQSGQLKTHQRLHTGERPFICSVPSCQQRFTHANRHCPDHPYDQLKRCDDFVIQPLSEDDSDVVKWLQKYKMEKEDRTPTRKTPKRAKHPNDNSENVSSSEPSCPSTPSNPYKSRKGLMVELDMNAGLEVSPVTSKYKSNPKVIEWTEPIAQDDDDDDSADECEVPICSTFNPKKRWLREAWQDDLAKPLDPLPLVSLPAPMTLSQTYQSISPKKQRNPNEMRPTVLMVASKDRTMPLVNTVLDKVNVSNSIEQQHYNHPKYTTQSNENCQKSTVLSVPTAGSRKWLGALALMQLTSTENNDNTIDNDLLCSPMTQSFAPL